MLNTKENVDHVTVLVCASRAGVTPAPASPLPPFVRVLTPCAPLFNKGAGPRGPFPPHALPALCPHRPGTKRLPRRRVRRLGVRRIIRHLAGDAHRQRGGQVRFVRPAGPSLSRRAALAGPHHRRVAQRHDAYSKFPFDDALFTWHASGGSPSPYNLSNNLGILSHFLSSISLDMGLYPTSQGLPMTTTVGVKVASQRDTGPRPGRPL